MLFRRYAIQVTKSISFYWKLNQHFPYLMRINFKGKRCTILLLLGYTSISFCMKYGSIQLPAITFLSYFALDFQLSPLPFNVRLATSTLFLVKQTGDSQNCPNMMKLSLGQSVKNIYIDNSSRHTRIISDIIGDTTELAQKCLSILVFYPARCASTLYHGVYESYISAHTTCFCSWLVIIFPLSYALIDCRSISHSTLLACMLWHAIPRESHRFFSMHFGLS